MSKSIYDEALENLQEISENHVQLTKEKYETYPRLESLIKRRNTHYSVIENALKKAQKQEKLLGLYKKHYELVPFKPGLGDKAKTVIDIQKQIKELENERISN